MKLLKNALVAAALLIATPALAIDFDQKITNLDGSAIVDDKGQEVNLTVRIACVNALMMALSSEEQGKPDSGIEKTRRDALARHVMAAPYKEKNEKSLLDQKKFPEDKYVFTSEDVSLMKKLVNNMYPSPLVVSQLWKALEEK